MAKETTIEQWLTRITLFAALGLGGTSLGLRPEYNGPTKEEAVALAVKLERIDNRLSVIENGKVTDAKHWKFLNWLETCVRDLAHKHDTRLEPKPSL